MLSNPRSILALAALVGAAAADPIEEPGTASRPGEAAAPLVYVYVPSPLGGNTSAERLLEDMRLEIELPSGDTRTASVSSLLLMERIPMPEERHVAASPEPPRPVIGRAIAERPASAADAAAEARMMGALEAMGLKPEDLVEKPKMSASALAVANAIARVDALLGGSRRRAGASAGVRVDPGERRSSQPSYVRHAMPQGDSEPKANLVLYAKHVTRSIYKIILGVAIGILIWGFVRDTG